MSPSPSQSASIKAISVVKSKPQKGRIANNFMRSPTAAKSGAIGPKNAKFFEASKKMSISGEEGIYIAQAPPQHNFGRQ